MEKKKRRRSQVFQFEQSQEALEENEKLKELYQNKNYVLPVPKELETIVEERHDVINDQRSRRAAQIVSADGGLILGTQLGKRMIHEYRYWKQDDKERIKRRKALMTKQWKGRRKPKFKRLDAIGEQKLRDLIELKDDSGCEDSLYMDVNGVDELKARHAPETCVWGERLLVDDSSVEEGAGCIWQGLVVEQEVSQTSLRFCDQDIPDIEPTEIVLDLIDLKVDEGVEKEVEVDESISIKKRNSIMIEAEDEEFYNKDKLLNNSHNDHSLKGRNSMLMPNHNESDVFLDALSNIIPENELAELLDTADLLFCGSGKPGVVGSQNGRRSVRRSARFNASLGSGLVFTEETVPWQIPSELCQKSLPLPTELEEDYIERRKSLHSTGIPSIEINYYEDREIIDTLSIRTSDEVSGIPNSDVRRSSLGVSGEVDISLPDSVRRSLTGEFVPRKSLQTVWEFPSENIKESKINSMSSDSDEELISGIYGKKTLVPRTRKVKKSKASLRYEG